MSESLGDVIESVLILAALSGTAAVGVAAAGTAVESVVVTTGEGAPAAGAGLEQAASRVTAVRASRG
jgi:hypothetical protein